jgi:probable HAF family extracellular repeat protein
MKQASRLSIALLFLGIPFLAQDFNISKAMYGQGVIAGINASGELAGFSISAGGFVWTRTGGPVLLPTLGGGASDPSALNDSGEVAGTGSLPSGVSHAFFWTPTGGIKDLGSPLGGDSIGMAINADGDVAGLTFTPDHSIVHGFFWSTATGTVDLGIPVGTTQSRVAALNKGGEIAGEADNQSGFATPFSWKMAGGFQILSTLGGPGGTPWAINDSGQIAGDYFAGVNTHAVLWAPDGSANDLGTLPGDTDSQALRINAAGHVYGVSSAPNSGGHTFFWSPETGMLDVTVYVTHSGFNNRDQILGTIGAGPYLWSPTGGFKAINSKATPAGLLNDAGQFVARLGKYTELFTPIMHVGLASSQNPSRAGQSVTFTASVSAIVGLPPDGEQVTFKDGSKVIGTGTLLSGSASVTTSSLKVGTRSIIAIYAGDVNYDANKSAKLPQVVNP